MLLTVYNSGIYSSILHDTKHPTSNAFKKWPSIIHNIYFVYLVVSDYNHTRSSLALLARVQYNLTMKAMYYINGQIDLTSYCLVNESLLLSALVVVYVLRIDVSFICNDIVKKSHINNYIQKMADCFLHFSDP